VSSVNLLKVVDEIPKLFKGNVMWILIRSPQVLAIVLINDERDLPLLQQMTVVFIVTPLPYFTANVSYSETGLFFMTH